MSKHLISRASQLFFGNAYAPKAYADNEKPGVPFHPITKYDFGAIATLDTDAIVAAATTTELPNVGTKSYTGATDGVSPMDGAIAAPSTVFANGLSRTLYVLDVPRNVTALVTHDSSVVAMTILVSGYDQYLQPMSELLTITATGTSKAAAGKKAFKYIEQVDLISAGNSTTNTANVGFGDVIGLPFVLSAKSDLMQTWFNQVVEATVPTIVLADATTATNATGDVRGTIDVNSAMDGSVVSVYIKTDPSTNETLYGITQA